MTTIVVTPHRWKDTCYVRVESIRHWHNCVDVEGNKLCRIQFQGITGHSLEVTETAAEIDQMIESSR